VQFERDTVKKNISRMEKKVEEVFNMIPGSAEEGNIPTEENIKKIAQTMEVYKVHITKLISLLQPSTPP
jgi:hypothetical protein